MKVFLPVLLIVIMVTAGPYLLLVGLNLVIDPLAIQVPYTLNTWFGALLIMLTIGGSSRSS
jgi:hypothetical protein